MPGIDKNTLLMLHGNEFVDVSPMKKKITNRGATISEETHFQGQKSFYFDGSTKVVQVEPPAYDLGAGDFTIDWWENCTTGVRFSTNYSLEEGGILLGYDGKALYIGEPGEWEVFYNQTAFNVTPGQWVHWAFVRNGSTFTSYRNGKRFWSGTSDKRIYFDATDIWSIGNYRPDGISAFNGHIQEFRISNIARWTSDFEPPTEPYSPENAIEVTIPRENSRTTFCRQFTYNPKGEYNSRRDGAIVSGMPVAGISVSELPLKTRIRVPVNPSYLKRFGEYINFMLAGKNHAGYPKNSVSLLTEKIIQLMCFDAKEPSNPAENRRLFGNNRYTLANIQQWANSEAGPGLWYSSTHEYDAPPQKSNVKDRYNSYDDLSGFLAILDTGFVSKLMETSIVCSKPNADGGGQELFVAKMFLPSASEVGLGGISADAEGVTLEIFTDATSRIAYPTEACVLSSDYKSSGLSSQKPWGWMVRTPNTLSNYTRTYVNVAGGLNTADPVYNSIYGFRPICNIPSFSVVDPTPNPDGSYNLIY